MANIWRLTASGTSVERDMIEIFGLPEAARQIRASSAISFEVTPKVMFRRPIPHNMHRTSYIANILLALALLCAICYIAWETLGNTGAGRDTPVTSKNGTDFGVTRQWQSPGHECSHSENGLPKCRPNTVLVGSANLIHPRSSHALKPIGISTNTISIGAEADHPCALPGYESQDHCPSKSVLKAERELSNSYAEAIHANVSEQLLSKYFQRWQNIRQGSNQNPQQAITDYKAMISELKIAREAQNWVTP